MTSRPKRSAKKDRNHHLVSKVLREVYGARPLGPNALYCQAHGVPVMAIDTSQVGGLIGDWLIWVDQQCQWVEVKHFDSRKRLTLGEKVFVRTCPDVAHIVTTEQEFLDLLAALRSKP
jgi:hypothetical protein